MPRDQSRYLHDIQSACIRIQNYTAGFGFSSYENIDQVRDSVERCFEIIGEAVRQMIRHYPDMVAFFPDASSMIGLRNILAHEYGEVEDERVWWVVENKVPELLLRVTQELNRRKKEQNDVE